MQILVRDPEGHRWHVRRRWFATLPGLDRAQRFLERSLHGLYDVDPTDLLERLVDGAAVQGLVLLPFALVVFLVILFVCWFVLPALITIAFTLVVVGQVAVSLVGHFLLDKPWIVEARSDHGPIRTWPVRGHAESKARVLEVGRQITAGTVTAGRPAPPNPAGGPGTPAAAAVHAPEHPGP